MSIYGMVRCRCFEEGLASPSPVPVRVDEHDELEAVDVQFRAAVWEWQRGACTHPDMAAAECHLAWRIVRSFYAELERDQDERYPVLLANVPQWNGAWFMTPAEAAAALEELRLFESAHPPLRMDRLVDPSGTKLHLQVEHGGDGNVLLEHPRGRYPSVGRHRGWSVPRVAEQ